MARAYIRGCSLLIEWNRDRDISETEKESGGNRKWFVNNGQLCAMNFSTDDDYEQSKRRLIKIA